MDVFNRKYAELLGVKIEANVHDGGARLALRSADGQTAAFFTYSWGEEDALNRRVLKWLHTQPWPQEDDPRVVHVTLSREGEQA